MTPTRDEILQFEQRLVRSPDAAFDPGELGAVPEPVSRYLRASIEPGTPAAQSCRIEMSGQIRIGRWIGFRATEVLTPHAGFVWAARAAGVISGSDRYLGGEGAMNWKLAGLIPVMRVSGDDVSRSAAQRGGAEAVWLPTTLLPRFDVEWTAASDRSITARYAIDDHPIELSLDLDTRGLPESVVLPRWGDPDETGTFANHPFGGDFTSYETFDGLTVPTRGIMGWHYGTDRWDSGQFFRFEIDQVEPL